MIKWEPGERIVSSRRRVVDNVIETDEWEVVERGRIRVIQTSPHLGSYLNVGQEYTLTPHTPQSYLELWEIDVETTDRPDSSSQVLLYDWRDMSDAKPSIEVDF